MTHYIPFILSTMAQLLRTPKSGSDWTASELYIYAYNITVVPQTKMEFFGTVDLPEPGGPSLAGFMVAETRQEVRDKRTKQLLHCLDLAMNPKVGQEAAVGNFAAELLRGLEYDDENMIAFIQYAIPFLICGENVVAQTDVCIMDDNEILLLLQEDKNLTSMKDPEPQVIANAIGAFALNNRIRQHVLNLLCSIDLNPSCSLALPWLAPCRYSTKSPSLLH
jgi:hypothetical protein